MLPALEVRLKGGPCLPWTPTYRDLVLYLLGALYSAHSGRQHPSTLQSGLSQLVATMV